MNSKKGTLREAFEGEQPDFVQSVDELCTGMAMYLRGEEFFVDFVIPIPLESGVGYVFEESVE